MVDIGAKILGTSLPAFIFGHAFLCVSLYDRGKNIIWKFLAAAGYSVCLACLFVGMIILVWL